MMAAQPSPQTAPVDAKPADVVQAAPEAPEVGPEAALHAPDVAAAAGGQAVGGAPVGGTDVPVPAPAPVATGARGRAKRSFNPDLKANSVKTTPPDLREPGMPAHGKSARGCQRPARGKSARGSQRQLSAKVRQDANETIERIFKSAWAQCPHGITAADPLVLPGPGKPSDEEILESFPLPSQNLHHHQFRRQ